MSKDTQPTARIIRFEPRDLMTWEEVRACGLGPIPPDAAEAIDGYHEELAPVVELHRFRSVRMPRDR